MTDFEKFYNLHRQKEPLIIGNAWNVQSAKLLEKNRLQALATSSAAVAETLGYDDGEEMSFDEYIFVIRRIKATTSLPLSVDLETGYGKTIEEVVDNMQSLSELGVVGVNIEDSTISNGNRKLSDASFFAEKLCAICTALHTNNIEMFINVRCDAFLLSLPGACKEAIQRLTLYQQAGVHGLFLPCLTDLEEIKAIVRNITLPLNVMCMPNLPDFDQLKSAGVKRISMGNFLNKASYSALDTLTKNIIRDNNFSSLFS